MANLTTPWFEAVTQFGSDGGLVGIVCHPRKPRLDAPTVILLNSGIIHRVGTNRLSVVLARELATLGVRSLRFDLSGVGDSERRSGTSTVRESVECDIAESIHHMLSKEPGARFVLFGLCSGAFDAFHVALRQPSVVGALMVDLPGPFRGRHHTLHHLRARLFRLASWKNPLRKLLHYSEELLGAARATSRTGEVFVPGGRSAMRREHMAASMADLLNRGVQLAFVFTAGLESNYNHRSQFAGVFPDAASHARLVHAFFPEADHSFSAHRERLRLVAFVLDWTSRNWLGSSAHVNVESRVRTWLNNSSQRVASILALAIAPKPLAMSTAESTGTQLREKRWSSKRSSASQV